MAPAPLRHGRASEGRHPAFPGAHQRAGPMERRLSAPGKAECLPSEDTPLPVTSADMRPRPDLDIDGPLEGRHPAFPGAHQRAGPMERRLSAPGKAECLPSEDTPLPVTSADMRPRPDLDIDGPLEGRHPAFPGAHQRAGPMERRLPAPGKAECLPSEDTPLPVTSADMRPRPDLGVDGPLEERHPAFPGAHQRAGPMERRLSAPGKAECLPSEDTPLPGTSADMRPRPDLDMDGPLEGRHPAFPGAGRRLSGEYTSNA